MEIFIHSVDEFKEYTSKGKVLVDFYATWCGPCQRLGPILEEFAQEHPEIDVLKIDVDEVSDLAVQFGVASIPTLILFIDGEAKATSLGYMLKQAVEDFVGI